MGNEDRRHRSRLQSRSIARVISQTPQTAATLEFRSFPISAKDAPAAPLAVPLLEKILITRRDGTFFNIDKSLATSPSRRFRETHETGNARGQARRIAFCF
jgi:hypothetical protein